MSRLWLRYEGGICWTAYTAEPDEADRLACQGLSETGEETRLCGDLPLTGPHPGRGRHRAPQHGDHQPHRQLRNRGAQHPRGVPYLGKLIILIPNLTNMVKRQDANDLYITSLAFLQVDMVDPCRHGGDEC